MANHIFTDNEIQEILNLINATRHTQYIGARYVPIFGRKGETTIEWDNTAPYEPLTIVLHKGNSYTSRQYVPTGIDITNTEYWTQTGNYNAQIEEYRKNAQAGQHANDLLAYMAITDETTAGEHINAIEKNHRDTLANTNTLAALGANTVENATNLKNIINSWVSPITYGAKLDGITDDTSAIQQAVNTGNVLFPYNSKVKCGTINVPNNRIIDFNNTTVTQTDSIFIQIGSNDLTSYNYAGFCTIKNLIMDESADRIINAQQAINVIIDNILCKKFTDNDNYLITFENCFNVQINNVWIGNDYNTTKQKNGISITANNNGKITGTEDATNCTIKNCLIQNVNIGTSITTEGVSGGDSIILENNGYSRNNTAIYLNSGRQNDIHTLSIINCRIEVSRNGIITNTYTTINSIHIYKTNTAITNKYIMILSGDISFQEGDLTECVGITSSENSRINLTSAIISASSKYTFNLHNALLPYHPVTQEHSGTNFDNLIQVPYYNYKVHQNNFFDLTLWPTDNVPDGKELTIFGEGTTFNPIIRKDDTTSVYFNFKYNSLMIVKFNKYTKTWNIVGNM